MRFFENGPVIPDELLEARDQGSVIFFCGAGVSKARANLPDFMELTKDVLEDLGVLNKDEAYRVLKLSERLDRWTKIPSVISIDRIYGLLERDFSKQDIEHVVAKTLKPADDCDTSAHKILIDLATTVDRQLRLVTTNFDRLFDPHTKKHTWKPRRFPDPARPEEMDGVIYLHGKASEDYTRAEENGFVLSSADFGRAYLSEGWATEFVREAIAQFTIVFVGYSADDPPMLYLLEALNTSAIQNSNLFAFQSGDHENDNERWKHKGVQAISHGSHENLWSTLEAWSERAKDPISWTNQVVEKAKTKPSDLKPHERGQVAHIVSTLSGAQKFAEADPSPPADWLCVFDPSIRYGDVNPPQADPFTLYGLDSDVIPPGHIPKSPASRSTDNLVDSPRPINRESQEREAPQDAWNAFRSTERDVKASAPDNFPQFSGVGSSSARILPRRLRWIATWLARLIDQPTTIWWATRQTSIHPDVIHEINRVIHVVSPRPAREVRAIWDQIISVWQSVPDKCDLFDMKVLRENLQEDGWNSQHLQKYENLKRPYLKPELPRVPQAPTPPRTIDEIQPHKLFASRVEYPNSAIRLEITTEFLPDVIRSLRRNIEIGILLEKQIGDHGCGLRHSLIADAASMGKISDSLFSLVSEYALLLDQLARNDQNAAAPECNSWPIDDEVFARVRIWASANAILTPPEHFVETLGLLSARAFWDDHHQQDLLKALRARWKDLNKVGKEAMETRILSGPEIRNNEEPERYSTRRDYSIHQRLAWLKLNRCDLTVEAHNELARIRERHPNATDESAKAADEGFKMKVGLVHTEKTYEELNSEPVETIIKRAHELTGETENVLVRRDPFSGLAEESPRRALEALQKSNAQEHQHWAWKKFLRATASQEIPPEICPEITDALSGLTNERFADLIGPIAAWLDNTSGPYASHDYSHFHSFLKRVIERLKSNPEIGGTHVVKDDRAPSDWPMLALNSASGKIAMALLDVPRALGVKKVEDFPEGWFETLTELIKLPDPLRLLCLTIASNQLNWLYWHNSQWVRENILNLLDDPNALPAEAIWAGMLWRGETPLYKLYSETKSSLLDFVGKNSSIQGGMLGNLAGFLFNGWPEILSKEEISETLIEAGDKFRAEIIRFAVGQLDGDPKQEWAEVYNQFLKDVWPRRKYVRTQSVTKALCGGLLKSPGLFELLHDATMPHLSTLNNQWAIISHKLLNGNPDIVDSHPRKLIGFLVKILPEATSNWHDGIETIFDRMETADPSIGEDKDFKRLKLKWHGRRL